jgi:hypothetical protein
VEKSLESIGITYHHLSSWYSKSPTFLVGSKKGSETSDTYWKHSFAVFFAREECHSLEMITGRRCYNCQAILVGGFNHLEKYESQWEGLSHILWKNTNV